MLKKAAPLYLFCLFLIFITPGILPAAVTGSCRYCHSRDLSDCVDCHGQNPAGSQNLVPVPNGEPVPQVIHHLSGQDLAGGNFFYAADGYGSDPSTGHSVAGISRPKPPPMNTPPGFVGNVVIPGGTGPAGWTGQLACAGTYGCHGNRTIADPLQAIAGAHHADNSVVDGLTVGTSYRFLLGITGVGHKKWEHQAVTGNHNGYQGSRNYSSTNTISYFCGECHAQYHAQANLGGGSSYGLRHPVDISFSQVYGGYTGSEYQAYSTYNFDTPVAYLNPTGTETTVDLNSIVTCLSCHRAHASPYKKILRWDYSTVIAGSGKTKGCINCHSRK